MAYNPCDYQEGALQFAVSGWVAQALGIQALEICATFNSEANRYEFTTQQVAS